jgi:hypothetical protein
MGTSGEKRTVYHISPVRLWLLPGPLLVLAAVLLVAAFFITDKAGQAGGVVLAIMLLSMAVLFSPLVIYPRLELTAKGITLRQIGYQLGTTWDNVAQLHDVRSREGLILHRPMECRGAFLMRAFSRRSIHYMRIYDDLQSRLLSERRYIPIEAFAYWLKHGQLRDDLASHAPSIGSGSSSQRGHP